MITALTKDHGLCFRCPDFSVSHNPDGYEIAFQNIEWAAIPEADAIALVNRYLGVE
jgi:hypothetical protein